MTNCHFGWHCRADVCYSVSVDNTRAIQPKCWRISIRRWSFIAFRFGVNSRAKMTNIISRFILYWMQGRLWPGPQCGVVYGECVDVKHRHRLGDGVCWLYDACECCSVSVCMCVSVLVCVCALTNGDIFNNFALLKVFWRREWFALRNTIHNEATFYGTFLW